MGARNPDRVPRLASLPRSTPGFIRMVTCRHCGHAAPLPVRALIGRFGERFPVQEVRTALRFEQCKGAQVEMKLARLCDPGCPYWRD
jgi:hypothetical protein